MPLRSRFPAAALLLLTACAERSSPVLPVPPAAPTLLAALTCRAQRSPARMSCTDATAAGASLSLLVYGGQHRYVRLTSGETSYNGVSDQFLTAVSAQNLLLVPVATSDGATPDADGVRIFFEVEPDQGVTIANASGTGTFTSAAHPYFQYADGDLGADGLLAPEETSLSKGWIFDLNGASSFTFTVYVAAQIPTGAAYATHLAQLSGGTAHTCGLDVAGMAFCWGSNANGAIGNGGLTDDFGVPAAVQMPGGVSFTAISAGREGTCALTASGSAWCWGDDLYGQLGNGAALTTDQFVPSPVVLPAGRTFVRIAAAEFDACAIDDLGNGWCWGNDGNGRLGNGPGTPVQEDVPSAVVMPAGVTFTAISSGYNHNCALGSDGKGYCWGWDFYGQLGNGPGNADQETPSQVAMPAGVTFTAISTGHDHTCAIGSDGHGYCWGSDSNGQLGNGVALNADMVSPSPVEMPAGVTFVRIAAGGQHSCALGSDGKMYCWGRDTSGQLGNGDAVTTDADAPAEVPGAAGATRITTGYVQSCLVSSSIARCWGGNSSHQVGDGTALDRASPVAVAATR